jgi:cation:H+ antiporter
MEASAVAFILVGIGALVLGADWLVRGASRIAARTGLSSVVIGLTVVAFGTSAPELAVSLGDVLRGGDDAGTIAIGNVVGSNIANILLALGVAAAVGGALIVAQRIVRIDVPIMIGVSVLFLVFSLDHRLDRWEGIVLAIGLIVYVTWTVVSARRRTADSVVTEYDEALEPESLKAAPVWVDILYVLGGLVFLVIGAQALVHGASDIAVELGVSDLVIGLTVVAIGTSLPEVATTVVAAMRGQRDLAVGNAIGSNLFNILAVLGITAIVSPSALPVPPSAIQVDIPVMIAVAVACLPIFMNGHVLKRWEGILFFLMYVGYLGWLVLDATESRYGESYSSTMLFFVVPIIAVTMIVVGVRAQNNPSATS